MSRCISLALEMGDLGGHFPVICRKNRGVRAEGERLTQKERECVASEAKRS